MTLTAILFFGFWLVLVLVTKGGTRTTGRSAVRKDDWITKTLRGVTEMKPGDWFALIFFSCCGYALYWMQQNWRP